MRLAEYDTLRASDVHHWWYAVLRSLVDKRLPSQGRLLDAGCGTGGMLEFLRDKISATGIDISAQAVAHCHQRGLHTVELGRVEALPFADETFDVVLSLDVLYHAGVNETRALAEMRRVLRPQGLLLLNLPAFASLRGSHDVAVAGARRYTAGRLRSLLEASSFTVESIQYWNAWLFFPLLLWRQISRLKSSRTSDLHLTPLWMNTILTHMGRLDARLCRGLHIPFGSSLFAVACKLN